tara:strand:- start:12139 stop:12441 length:303 start_codon:yes stop_codon:yes gene_type:complete
MIIYSVEISIAKKVQAKWLKWMRETHIPDVMRTNMFVKFSFYKKLNTSSSDTYIIEYETDDIKKYQKYESDFAIKLKKEHETKFTNQFSAKRSLFIKKII